MLSEFKIPALTFDELISRLRTYIRARINTGEFTERALARVFHISQPHLHNMLKGARQLNKEFADQVMSKFGITILDLINEEEIRSFLDLRNPDWLTQAALRKPPVKSVQRDGSQRSSGRTPQTGS